jgi:predicted ATPase
MNRFVVISGCSGGGKSALVDALSRRGHVVIEEPGRRIVKEELAKGGTALPWADPAAFARRAIAVSLADLAAAENATGWVFFDRGLIDAETALRHATNQPLSEPAPGVLRYHRRVFLAPPWREIYRQDPQRRHGYDEAVDEYQRLAASYAALGYEIILLPKLAVETRVGFVITTLSS